jgi:hypothetical protein
MQDDYPAGGGVRLRRVCDSTEATVGSGRLFLCGGCRAQVVVCSCCDRGQVYCPDGCAKRARHRTLRQAAQRYRRTGRARRMHAARTARWRARQRESVTHHGSPVPVASALVAGGTASAPCGDVSPAEPPLRAVTHCHWCKRVCLPRLRQGFLRRRDRRRDAEHDRTERNTPW